ncbi:unnamed protein product [Closterium sp. NIES-65]|nr:unnamed protein product [Closterium sp. NIES-65]
MLAMENQTTEEVRELEPIYPSVVNAPGQEQKFIKPLDGDSVLAASEEPRRSSGDAAAAGASGDAGAAVGAVNGGGDGAVGEGSFRQGLEDVELKMKIGNPGQSCDDTCAERGLKCQADLLPRINNCPLLRHFFPCTPGCFASLGTEQPAEPPRHAQAVPL